MNTRHGEAARQVAAAAARRRADLERWKETYRRIIETKVHSDEEEQARRECLMLLEQARP